MVGHVVPGGEDGVVADSNAIKSIHFASEPGSFLRFGAIYYFFTFNLIVVVGNTIIENIEQLQGKDYKLEFIEDLEEITNKNREKNYFIANIESFKKDLKVYPSSKKLK